MISNGKQTVDSITTGLMHTTFGNTRVNEAKTQEIDQEKVEKLISNLHANIKDSKHKEAAALLEENKSIASELLISKSDFGDHARIYKSAPLLKYILWIQDWRMLEIARKYISDEMIADHWLELDTNGLEYQEIQEGNFYFNRHNETGEYDLDSDIEKKCEPSYSRFKIYIAAWENYIDEKKKSRSVIGNMHKVKQEQVYVPAHLVKSICHGDRAFSAEVKFNEGDLPSDYPELLCYDDISEKLIKSDFTWFKAAKGSGSCSYIIIGSVENGAVFDIYDEIEMSLDIANLELAGLKALDAAHALKWAELKKIIMTSKPTTQIEESSNSSYKSHGLSHSSV